MLEKFDKIQQSFIIKALRKLEIEGTYLNTTKNMYDTIIDILLNGENWKHFP
jgi:hypothetical protein